MITPIQHTRGPTFHDFDHPTHAQANFSTWIKSNDQIQLGMECSVTVLTTGFWPTYKV
jgi:hypothetical protein